MDINEIISQLTVLKDYTATNSFAWVLMLAGALGAGFFIWSFIDGFYFTSIRRKIFKIIFVLIGIFGIVFGAFFFIKRPFLIDYYISVNNVEIEQVSKYFDISELSQMNDVLVCHIAPKADYYEDVLNWHLNKEE